VTFKIEDPPADQVDAFWRPLADRFDRHLSEFNVPYFISMLPGRALCEIAASSASPLQALLDLGIERFTNRAASPFALPNRATAFAFQHLRIVGYATKAEQAAARSPAALRAKIDEWSKFIRTKLTKRLGVQVTARVIFREARRKTRVFVDLNLVTTAQLLASKTDNRDDILQVLREARVMGNPNTAQWYYVNFEPYKQCLDCGNSRYHTVDECTNAESLVVLLNKPSVLLPLAFTLKKTNHLEYGHMGLLPTTEGTGLLTAVYGFVASLFLRKGSDPRAAAVALLEEHGDTIQAVGLGSNFARRGRHHCFYCGKSFTKRNHWQRHTRSCDAHSADREAVNFARRQSAAMQHILHGIQPPRRTVRRRLRKPRAGRSAQGIVVCSSENVELPPTQREDAVPAADSSFSSIELPEPRSIEPVSDIQQQDAPARNPLATSPKATSHNAEAPTSTHGDGDNSTKNNEDEDEDEEDGVPLFLSPEHTHSSETDIVLVSVSDDRTTTSSLESGSTRPNTPPHFMRHLLNSPPTPRRHRNLESDLLHADSESDAESSSSTERKEEESSSDAEMEASHPPVSRNDVERAIAAVRATLDSSKEKGNVHRSLRKWSKLRLPFNLQGLVLEQPPDTSVHVSDNIYTVLGHALGESGQKKDATEVFKELQSYTSHHSKSDSKNLKNLKARVSLLLQPPNCESPQTQSQTRMSPDLLRLAAAKYSTKIVVTNTIPNSSFDGLASVFDQDALPPKTDSLADLHPPWKNTIVLLMHGNSCVLVSQNRRDASDSSIHPSAPPSTHSPTLPDLFLWWRFLGLLHSLSEQKLLLDPCDDILHLLTPNLIHSDSGFSLPLQELHELARRLGWLQPISSALYLHPWMRIVESVDVRFKTAASVLRYLKKNTTVELSTDLLERQFKMLVLQNHRWSHPELRPPKRFTLNVFSDLVSIAREQRRKQTQTEFAAGHQQLHPLCPTKKPHTGQGREDLDQQL